MHLRVAVPSPSCSVTSLFCKKIYNDFLSVNPFCRFFREFWLATAGSFLSCTNEQDGEQNAFMVNFSDNSDLRQGLGQVSLTLGIEKFQEDSKP